MTPVSAPMYAPNAASTDIASPVPALVTTNTAALGSRPEPAHLAAALFDLRRDLVEYLLRLPMPAPQLLGASATGQPAKQAPEQSPADLQKHEILLSTAQEDVLRDALPPLHVPAGPYTPVFSAWRGAVAAVIGLIFGSALIQGLHIGGALAVLGGMVGVGAALWLADSLARVRATGLLHYWGHSLRWKHLRRWGRVFWGAVLVLTLLRDFLQQQPVLEEILRALSAFVTQGAALPLLQNMYCLLGFIAVFMTATRRPVRLDMAEYHARLHMVAQTWWDSALLVRDSILLHYAANHGADSALRQKAAQELYSFAAELPSAQSYWLRERLDSLGFSTPAVEGELRWGPALAATYDALGHMTEGDSCFVDTPPLMDGEQVLRKGTVRKIRTQA